jgi:uncharacterized membrane protein
MNPDLLEQFGRLGANGLPYPVPIHPALVHLTLGLFIAAIAFDIVAALFDVGWYNLLGAAVITFFTVAAGFFEISLAVPLADVKSAWGLQALKTMVLHGAGGITILALIVLMAVWRGFQRFSWRKDMARQVQWSYLAAGLVIFVLMFVQGTLGAHLGGEFGIHVTADQLLHLGEDPNRVLQ